MSSLNLDQWQNYTFRRIWSEDHKCISEFTLQSTVWSNSSSLSSLKENKNVSCIIHPGWFRVISATPALTESGWMESEWSLQQWVGAGDDFILCLHLMSYSCFSSAYPTGQLDKESCKWRDVYLETVPMTKRFFIWCKDCNGNYEVRNFQWKHSQVYFCLQKVLS